MSLPEVNFEAVVRHAAPQRAEVHLRSDSACQMRSPAVGANDRAPVVDNFRSLALEKLGRARSAVFANRRVNSLNWPIVRPRLGPTGC